MSVSQQFGKDVHPIMPLTEAEWTAVPRKEKVVISFHAALANKQSAAPHQFLVAINPDVEILARLIAGKSDEHVFDDPPTF
jgi:hypothetical protein